MDVVIKIVEKDNAVALLKDENFTSEWQEVANQNEKVTVTQEPAFATTWYRIYAEVYDPILVLGYNDKEQLVGLIPLAFSKEDQSIVFAGTEQAEYHGWLCTKEFDQDFPVQALISIKQNFELKKWFWGWVPPGSNLNWLSAPVLKKEKIYVKVYEQDSPVLDLSNDNVLEKLRKSRSLKTKINRFKKRGDLYIQRITTKEEATKVFDRLEKMCDFRKMTLSHVPPFTTDPKKTEFQIAKLAFLNLNHFAVLWSNDNPIAFHIGEADATTVYLGLMAHEPVEAKNSPGKILLIKLAELLKEEGFQYFDLTPGGDNYKTMFSNLNYKVYDTVIYFNRKDKIISDVKDSLKKGTKNSILFLGLNPTTIASFFHKVSDSLKKVIKLTPRKIVRKLISFIYKKDSCIYYKYEENDTSFDFLQNDQISKNKYADLILNNDNNRWTKKLPLISEAQRRFIFGDHLYTLVKNEGLAHHLWVRTKSGRQTIPEVDMEFNCPEKSIVLSDFITNSDFSSESSNIMIIKKILKENSENQIEKIFIKQTNKDALLKEEIEKIGFKVYRKFERTKILGVVRKNEYS